jgi:hypothetical protein
LPIAPSGDRGLTSPLAIPVDVAELDNLLVGQQAATGVSSDSSDTTDALTKLTLAEEALGSQFFLPANRFRAEW